MEARVSSSLGLPSPKPDELFPLTEFPSILNHFATLIHSHSHHTLPFASTSNSLLKCPKPQAQTRPKPQSFMKNLSVLERAFVGAGGCGIAGAFTYVCLLPLDTIKTKMQTKGASQIYKNTLYAVVKTFQSKGILGFYSGRGGEVVAYLNET